MRGWILFTWLLAAGMLSASAQERFAGMAQDGTGRVWTIPQDGTAGLAWQKGTKSQLVAVPEEGFVPKCLTALSDGSVACLWGAPWNRPGRSALTRYDGDKHATVHNMPALKDGRILERRDGSLLVTESGPSLVLVPKDGAPRALTIPDEYFHNRNSASKSSPQYRPVCAVEDAEQRIWLWSLATAGADKLQLTSFIRIEGHQLTKHPLDAIVTDREISDMVLRDPEHFWVAMCGFGLYSLEIGTMKIERLSMEVPKGNDQGLQWVEQIFREGDDWFVVVYPKPPTTELVRVNSGIANVFATSTRRFHDPAKPCGRLLRYREGKWEVMHDGLDARPRFGWRERPHALTQEGLLLGTHAGGPWLTVRPGGEPAVLHRWETGFALPDAVQLSPLTDGTMRALASTGEIALVLVEPAAANPRGLRSFTSVHGAVEDSKGNLWCMRDNETLVKWDGASWSEQAPPKLKPKGGFEWWGDDRDQGWFLGDEQAAICDFTTGAWQHYPTRHAALVAQLPQGTHLSYIGQQYWLPVYSGSGQIAWLSGFSGLQFYDGAEWRKWTMREIAGQDLQLEGGPFFNSSHQLCLPMGKTNFTWDADANTWQRVPRPASEGDRAVNTERPVIVPEGCTVTGHTSGANDSLGTAWLSAAGELFRAVPGRTVKILSKEEPNPIRFGRKIRQALIDPRGGVMLLVSGWQEEPVEYLHVPAKLPAPSVTAKLQAVGGNTARIQMATAEPAGETWFSWQLDGGSWQAVQQEKVLTLTQLAAGQPRLAIRAYNAELGASRTPALLSFKIEADAVKTMEGNIADLSHPTRERREAAARQLRAQGIAALPALKEALKSRATDGLWWVHKVIEQIEADLAPETKKKLE